VGKHYLVSPSFEQLASRFLSEHVRKNLSKHTAKEYTRIIKRERVPCWGWRSAQSIEPSDVRALLTASAKERGSVVMSERVSGLLSNIFSFGIRNGWLKENPAKNSVLPRLSSEPLRVMSKDELRQLWSLLLEEKSLSSCILRVMLLTGQRPGLVSSMRWEDIRFERWVIKRREKPDGLSRSIFPRSIFLSVEARETLKEALSLGGVQDFVFPSRDGGHIRHLRKSSARMSKKMSNSAPWSPLDIYRSIPKHLRVEGVRPHVVQALLGRGPALPGEDHDGYFEDIKAALQLWSDILTKPDKHPSGGRLGKLIPLFPEQKKS
jgi:integrase